MLQFMNDFAVNFQVNRDASHAASFRPSSASVLRPSSSSYRVTSSSAAA